MCLLEGLWHHFHTVYGRLIIHHVPLICFSTTLMGRAQDSVLPPLKIAGWEARPACPCPTEESKAIAVTWAKLDSQRGGW